jgi:flap endonuclease-1
MGIKGLNQVIREKANEGISTVYLEKYRGKKAAIDANLYLYKFLYGKANHIDGLFLMINKLRKFGIEPIFVFDGKAPDEKRGTIEERKAVKEDMKRKVEEIGKEIEEMIARGEDVEELRKEKDILEGKIVYVTWEIMDSAKKLMDLLGVVYVRGSGEAEQICVKLWKEKLVEIIITDDMDVFACGAEIVIRDFNYRLDYVREYNLKTIQNKLGMSNEGFLDMCILLGTDYNSRPKNMSIERICELGRIGKLDTIDAMERIRELFNVDRLTIEEKMMEEIRVGKLPNIPMLIAFLKTNSSLEPNVYFSRIQKMFYLF